MRVHLSPSSEEYRSVLRSFRATISATKTNDNIRIERIQNERLYRQYQIEKKHFYKMLQKDTQKTLYHGCPNDDAKLQSIMEQGLDRSRAGDANGVVYGHGVYFSTKASESHRYTVPSPKTGERTMFVCSVLIGKSTRGNSQIKRCPDGYHSTTNGSSIYVVYRDNQAYANYLIHYR
ncbi:unnamed protein product [Rotaria sp. Silwood1]|nr:unnamed protein product [Rotaria sp. Silwood1]